MCLSTLLLKTKEKCFDGGKNNKTPAPKQGNRLKELKNGVSLLKKIAKATMIENPKIFKPSFNSSDLILEAGNMAIIAPIKNSNILKGRR